MVREQGAQGRLGNENHGRNTFFARPLAVRKNACYIALRRTQKRRRVMQTTAIPAATAEAKANAEHLANYLAVMAAHDWRFEWSDDHSVWRAGQSSLAALRQAQPIVDPDFVHWNRCAPEDFHVHVFTPPAPAPGAAS